jgi:hypothetical protein
VSSVAYKRHQRDGLNDVLFHLIVVEFSELQSRVIAPVDESNSSPIEAHVQLLNNVNYHAFDVGESHFINASGTVEDNHKINDSTASCARNNIQCSNAFLTLLADQVRR